MIDFDGAKLAIISRGCVLTLLRDDLPDIPFPNRWDLPGGGREDTETPDECALRELYEEFGLSMAPHLISLRTSRPHHMPDRAQIWFLGAHWHDLDLRHVRFGDEGQGWALMPTDEFIAHPCGIAHLQAGVAKFLAYGAS